MYRNRKLILLAWYLKIFRGWKITHAFFYSQGQKDLTDKLIAPFGVKVLFQGKEYTEMREIKHGWCNWPDSRLIGLGSNKDLSYKVRNNGSH